MEPLEEELIKLEIEKTKAETVKIKAETFSRRYKKRLDWTTILVSLLTIVGTIFVLYKTNVFAVNAKQAEISKYELNKAVEKYTTDTTRINDSIRIIRNQLGIISRHLDSVSHRNDVVAAQQKQAERDLGIYKAEVDKEKKSLTKDQQKAAQDKIEIANQQVVNATNAANASKVDAITDNSTDNQTIWKKAIHKIDAMYVPIKVLTRSFNDRTTNPEGANEEFQQRFTAIRMQYGELRDILRLSPVGPE